MRTMPSCSTTLIRKPGQIPPLKTHTIWSPLVRGLVSAAGAACVGADVTLIESHLLGADCLNVGCLPSKALLKNAKVATTIRNAAANDVRVDGHVSVDFCAI